jgi:hypothetical protein
LISGPVSPVCSRGCKARNSREVAEFDNFRMFPTKLTMTVFLTEPGPPAMICRAATKPGHRSCRRGPMSNLGSKSLHSHGVLYWFAMKDLLEFVLAVANNWAGYATGGTIVASVWLYYVWRDRPMPRVIGFALAGLFLLLAFFKAWREQRARVEASSEQIKILQSKLDSLTLSDFHGTMDWAVIGSGPNGSHIGLIVSLTNKGAPSAIDNGSWTLKAILSDAIYEGKPNTLLNKNLDFCFPPNKVMRFVRSDALYLKLASPLPMNGLTQGFIWFAFPGTQMARLMLPTTIIRLEARSVSGQSIKVESSIGDLVEKSITTKLFIGIENPRVLETPCKENQPY